MSDDTDMCQRAPLLDPRERRRLGLPVYAELACDLNARRHPGPNAVLEGVDRLPEGGVVVGSGVTVVQHRLSSLLLASLLVRQQWPCRAVSQSADINAVNDIAAYALSLGHMQTRR